MIVLVDMDGTLADFSGRFVEQYNALYPAEPIGSPTTWSMNEEIPEDRRGSFWQIVSKEGFFSGLDPLPGAIEAFHAMRDAGHDAVLCTSPFIASRWCESEKRHWIEEHVGMEFSRSMVITHDKTLVRGDVLIDDRPDIIGRLKPAWQRVLLDQPYNHHLNMPRIARDWSNWQEVLEIIKK